MAAGVPTRLTAAEGRKFGLTLGLAFGAIALLLLWRGRQSFAMIALGLSALLLMAAFVAPTHLGPVERAWMGLAHIMSKVTTPIFMGIVYYVVITPIGYLRRRSGSPLLAPGSGATRWVPHPRPETGKQRMERQF